MGLFLTMMACRTSLRNDVINALSSIMKERGLLLKSKSKVDITTGKNYQYEITNEKNGWIQIFCPQVPDDSLANMLSKDLNVPVYQFHIHDGSFWIYKLFVSGKLIDKYNPIPDYWKKINRKESESWRGNSAILASIFKIEESKIKPYLIFWNNEKNKNKKAFPTDEFPLLSEWSMVDFQKKLGIEYPDFDRLQTLNLVRLTFKTKKKEVPSNGN